ncbi:sporulation-delaying protein SdpB family protein [Streptomyces sp. NPDC101150]|uniref:sporulation-delaying protein SdpB family protein n=1 Tax=Streptomyces sp. NPDC101150 TaxID=3366114 RepID=UPI00380F93F3
MNRLWQAAESFEPRGIQLALARLLLAIAQLTMLLSSPDRLLFANPPGATPETRCAGLKSVSLWCVTAGDAPGDRPGRILAIAVLLVVASGYRPRWTCVAHWYVTFSIAVNTTANNGGDRVAEILAMLLIPVCLNDQRIWSWRGPTRPLLPAWGGSAFAAHAVLRCQTTVIYLHAVISKLAFPAWRHGTALGVLVHDPQFGIPGAVQPLAQQLLSHDWATSLFTWSVLAVETLIALSMPFGRRTRRCGLVLAILLHGAIILLMGLFSFGLIMIALVLATSADRQPGRSTSDNTRQTAPALVGPRKGTSS